MKSLAEEAILLLIFLGISIGITVIVREVSSWFKLEPVWTIFCLIILVGLFRSSR